MILTKVGQIMLILLRCYWLEYDDTMDEQNSKISYTIAHAKKNHHDMKKAESNTHFF